MVKSVYIHIPFCKSKCYYCSFVSFPKIEKKKDYLRSLEKEINANYKNEPLNTLYFGGGTPSLLTTDEFGNIIKHFNITQNTEITAELNPDDLSYDYLRAIYDIGINRISIGCQTFDDGILKLINRRHNSSQVINSVQLAQNVGFKNISIDFIYGLPNQHPQMFINDLKMALKLGVAHISLYGLSIESECYFAKNKPENLPDEDMLADMFLEAVEFLSGNRFEHYEFSNFSLAGFESRHNMNYWNNQEYYGFGVSAHGYVNDIRYENSETLEEYIQNPLIHKDEKFLTQKEKLEEEIFLGFRRLSVGINIKEINLKYNIDFEEKYRKILKKYESLNLLKKTSDGYSLTTNGVLVSNTILADFLE